MQSPWGPLEVRDAHVHFFSHRFFELLGRLKGETETAGSVCQALGWPAPPQQPEHLAAAWTAELDRHAVASACLIASHPDDADSVLRAAGAFPERIHPYTMFHAAVPGAPAKAAALLDAGMRALCLFPAMHGYRISDAAVAAVAAETAARPGRVLFVHCGELSIGVRAKLGLPSPFDMSLSNPADLAALANRFPALPIVVPHFGAGRWHEALELGRACPNVYFDTSSTNSWLERCQPPLSLPDVFRKALETLGEHRLLFGSDSSFFPRGWHSLVWARQVDAWQSIGLSRGVVQGIAGGNLRKLF